MSVPMDESSIVLIAAASCVVVACEVRACGSRMLGSRRLSISREMLTEERLRAAASVESRDDGRGHGRVREGRGGAAQDGLRDVSLSANSSVEATYAAESVGADIKSVSGNHNSTRWSAHDNPRWSNDNAPEV
jgi:hypothetical protein